MRVALIGVVTETTPTIVAPTGIADVEFVDEADAVNHWVPSLQAKGIEAIGVLMHEGGEATGPAALDPNGCDQLDGAVVDINDRIDPAVDLARHRPHPPGLQLPAARLRWRAPAGHPGRLLRPAGHRHPADAGRRHRRRRPGGHLRAPPTCR